MWHAPAAILAGLVLGVNGGVLKTAAHVQLCWQHLVLHAFMMQLAEHTLKMWVRVSPVRATPAF